MTRYYLVPTTFSEWRSLAGYSLVDCQIVFAVTKRTVSNWESGKIEPPRAVFICLQLFSGRLDFLGKRWRGFRITPECIESPDGDFVRCEEIRALRYAMQAMGFGRDRRCRMNEDKSGNVEPLNVDNKPCNVTLIDNAPKLIAVRKFAAENMSMRLKTKNNPELMLADSKHSTSTKGSNPDFSNSPGFSDSKKEKNEH